jgi:transposase
MTIHPDVVGIDVSKHHLDVFDAALDRGERLTNEADQIRALVGRWAEQGRFVVFEATGRYDMALRQALDAAGLRYARVNPAQARDFARAAGFLAKTDAVDARMLASLGLALRPRPTPPLDQARQRLILLHKRRDQLVGMRQQERTRRVETDDAGLAVDLDRHLAWLDQAVADFDRQIADLIADQPELRQAKALVQSIPGLGPGDRRHLDGPGSRAGPKLSQGARRPGRPCPLQSRLRQAARPARHTRRPKACPRRPIHRRRVGFPLQQPL